MSERAARGAIAFAFAFVVSACASGVEPAKMYETYLYSVAIPDSLGIQPITRDPEFLWANPGTTFLGESVSRSVGFRVEPAPGCTADLLRRYATDVRGGSSLTDKGDITVRTYGFGPGTSFTGMAGVDPAVIAIACDGTSAVTVLAIGLERDDVEHMLETFTFRDPPGDPKQPPSFTP